MSRGRPRGFDPELALDKALQVFWEKGFEGASLPELTRAMGINRPSMYAAFGNKEALFKKALQRYIQGPASYLAESLKQPVARDAVERLLRAAAELMSATEHPRGCLAVHGALACSAESAGVRQELIACRQAGEAAIRCRLERAIADGDLSMGTNPADTARFVATLIHGMSVQAAGGTSREDLFGVVDTALRAWPVTSATADTLASPPTAPA